MSVTVVNKMKTDARLDFLTPALPVPMETGKIIS